MSLTGELKVGIRDFLLKDLFGVLCKHGSVQKQRGSLLKNNKQKAKNHLEQVKAKEDALGTS